MHEPSALAPSPASTPAGRGWGAGWVVLGAAVTVGAWRIDRLESQGVPWFAAPGLLPGVLGLVIAGCGLWLALRPAAGSGHPPPAPDAEAVAAPRWGRVLRTLALCLGFAVLLVGRGLPFGLAAALYLFAHIALLQWAERGAAGQRLRGLVVAATVAAGVGIAVPFVFEQLFLVRLP